MTSFDLNSITSALENPEKVTSGVDFSGKSLKLDTENDAKPIVDAINACPDLQYLTLTGNTLGVAAAQAIAKALEHHPELKICRWSDMFTGRMKTEIPPALSALGDGMIAAGARLAVLDLSDNAFGPIGVEGLAALLRSDACSQLQELRLNNNGLGITGGKLLAKALAASPRRLKVFVAGRNRLENDGATALAQVFERMGSLEEVSMPQNGIYWAGVAALWAALERNPRLRSVDLNDNTVGARGAAAAAAALPRLKNLKSLNFGDCLLKSKGARTLAKAFKEHSVALECVDLSHNEIGREACMQVAEALTHSSDSLSRVVLAGNSLGGAAHKRALRDKLGDCADLSDGEDGTDSEGEEEEEEEDEESSEGENSTEGEDSATEDARHFNTVVETDVVQDITLDTSGVEEVETEVGRFLAAPSREALHRLGPGAAALIDTHLRSIKDPTDLIQAYVEATLAVSGACEGDEDSAISLDMYTVLLERAGQQHAAAWVLANAMLRGLALIKSENKDYKPRWSLPACYGGLARAMRLRAFPAALRDTLRFFIASKMPSMEPPLRDAVKQHHILYGSD